MRKIFAGLLLVLSLIIFGISAFYIGNYLMQEKKTDDTYEILRDILDSDENTEQDDVNLESEDDVQVVEIDEGLKKLHEENPDCIGWIHIEGTAIDYPVMYHPEEKEYYLHRNFYKEYDYSGTPYLAEICDPEGSDNLIIYGHHMNRGTMFADLERFKSEEFYHEYSMIELKTLHGNEEYQVIAAFAVPVYTGTDFAYYDFSKARNALEYAKYVEECRKRSYYDTGIAAFYGEKLITLSTCEYSHKNGRMVVVGKKIE